MKTVWIGNLNRATSAAAIRILFEPLGAVRSVQLLGAGDGEDGRRFACVEMADSEAAQAIRALNGARMDGRLLQLGDGPPPVPMKPAPNERLVPRL